MFKVEYNIQTGESKQIAMTQDEIDALAPVSILPASCTSLDFMDRFTEAEQLAIVAATMSVPQVKLWYDRMIAATQIVYKDPRVLGGLQALASAGLIVPSRVDEILPAEWR